MIWVVFVLAILVAILVTYIITYHILYMRYSTKRDVVYVTTPQHVPIETQPTDGNIRYTGSGIRYI